MSFISIATAGIGLGSNIVGMIGSRKARKEQQDRISSRQSEIDEQKAENQAFYDREYNKDFFDTNIGKNTIKQMDKSSEKAVEAAQNDATRGGGTADSQIAARGKIQEAKQDGMTNLAQQGTAYKSGVRNQFLSRGASLDNNAKFYDQAYSSTLDKQADSFGGLSEGGNKLFTQGFGSLANSDGKVGQFLQKSGFGGN